MWLRFCLQYVIPGCLKSFFTHIWPSAKLLITISLFSKGGRPFFCEIRFFAEIFEILKHSVPLMAYEWVRASPVEWFCAGAATDYNSDRQCYSMLQRAIACYNMLQHGVAWCSTLAPRRSWSLQIDKTTGNSWICSCFCSISTVSMDYHRTNT